MSSSSRRNSNIYTDIAGTGVTVIETVKGAFFLIDTDSRQVAEKHTWSLLPYGESGYAKAGLRMPDGKLKTVLLHRILLEEKACGSSVDHVNGQTFDCRVENLRVANKSLNACNQKRRVDNSTGVKGVYLSDGLFRARVHLNGKTHSVGRFHSLEMAKEAIVKKRNELHGEFARHE